MNIIIVNIINKSYTNDNGDTLLVIKFNSSTSKKRFMHLLLLLYMHVYVYECGYIE